MASSHSCSICTHTLGAREGVQTLACGEAACCSWQYTAEFNALVSPSQGAPAPVRMHIEHTAAASPVYQTCRSVPLRLRGSA